MRWPKKNSYKEFDDKKKFLRLENSHPPSITFLMFRPLNYLILSWKSSFSQGACFFPLLSSQECSSQLHPREH